MTPLLADPPPPSPRALATLRRDLGLFQLYRFLSTSYLFAPVIVVFFGARGLSMTEVTLLNSVYCVTAMLFEVPTGVVADTRGRRTSYLLGTLTLAFSTLLYLWMWEVSAPFWAWALTSAFVGLGFTFFSGAVEAWLVDALTFSGYFREGAELDPVPAMGDELTGGTEHIDDQHAGIGDHQPEHRRAA